MTLSAVLCVYKWLLNVPHNSFLPVEQQADNGVSTTAATLRRDDQVHTWGISAKWDFHRYDIHTWLCHERSTSPISMTVAVTFVRWSISETAFTMLVPSSYNVHIKYICTSVFEASPWLWQNNKRLLLLFDWEGCGNQLGVQHLISSCCCTFNYYIYGSTYMLMEN